MKQHKIPEAMGSRPWRRAASRISQASLRATFVALAMALLSASAVAATYQTNNVEGLVYLLKTYNDTSGTVIELAAGDYLLRDDLAWDTDATAGTSLLYCYKPIIRGMGVTPEATRLIGTGNMRVLRLRSLGKVENLTITNGYAKLVDGYTQSNRGGGVYGEGIVTNCLVIGNQADRLGGGGAGGVKFWNSRIVGNWATEGGGGFHGSNAYHSRIEGNRSNRAAGAYLNANTIRDCDVVGNVSVGGVGGVLGSGAGALLVDSRIYNNTAGGSGGGTGAAATFVVSNCLIYCNMISNATSASTINGGGMSGGNYTTVYDSEIYGNVALDCKVNGKTYYAASGGAHGITAYNCKIHNNYATSICGGIRGSTAYGCVISNNVSAGNGPNMLTSRLYSCDITGTQCYNGSATDSIFHDIRTVTLSGNPAGDVSYTPSCVWQGAPNATNCLFYGVNLPDKTLFAGFLTDTSAASLVNCTIVDNICSYMFANYADTNSHLSVVNTLFYGNRVKSGSGYVPCDLSKTTNVTTNGLRFVHSAYGVTDIANLADHVADTIYRFGNTSAVGTYIGEIPRFCGASKDPLHPYALRYSSTLRERGIVQDWMADATDLRGEGYARLRGGKVDIGCYQCWLDPKGGCLSFR